ncbi:MAG: hypothetical protein ACRDPD_13060 [Streptosporangiaceae bacterium]
MAGRSARDHLLYLAQTHGIPVRRVEAVLDQVGLLSADHLHTYDQMTRAEQACYHSALRATGTRDCT